MSVKGDAFAAIIYNQYTIVSLQTLVHKIVLNILPGILIMHLVILSELYFTCYTFWSESTSHPQYNHSQVYDVTNFGDVYMTPHHSLKACIQVLVALFLYRVSRYNPTLVSHPAAFQFI